MEWFGFGVGVVLLVSTLSSVVGTLVVPRGISSRASRWTDFLVDGLFDVAMRGMKDTRRREAASAWVGPVTLLVRLSVWVLLIWFAYALLLLPFAGGASLWQAGSSLFTLGYSPPTNPISSAIDYAAAFTGVVVIGLQVGYLPTIYSTYNRREAEVTLLRSRAGVPSWGPELLLRTTWGVSEVDRVQYLTDLFTTWERWAAEVGESHTTYVTLVRFRSPRALSNWATALIAVLDAAAIHLSVALKPEPSLSARLCLRMGSTALNQIAETMGLPHDSGPDPDRAISVNPDQFREALSMLREAGYPLEVDDDQAYAAFRSRRARYDTSALAIAKAIDAPPALWTGDRRFASEPIPPMRPATFDDLDVRWLDDGS